MLLGFERKSLPPPAVSLQGARKFPATETREFSSNYLLLRGYLALIRSKSKLFEEIPCKFPC